MVDGIIFSAMPAYNNSIPTAKLLASILSSGNKDKKVSKLLVKATDFNKFIKKPQTKFDWISYNQENINEYINDPLCGFPFTNRGYYDLFDGTQDVYVRKDWRVLKNNLPIFFIVGQDDVCADVASGFKKALNNLASVGYKSIDIEEDGDFLVNEKEKQANSIEPEPLEQPNTETSDNQQEDKD